MYQEVEVEGVSQLRRALRRRRVVIRDERNLVQVKGLECIPPNISYRSECSNSMLVKINYRGTSLTRNSADLGPYSRVVLRALW